MPELRLEIEPPHRRSGSRSFENFPVVIGRDPESDVPFDVETDQAVSWHHARIDSTPQGFVVTDCDTTNGTFLNGKPVTHANLQSGDLIQLGPGGPRLRLHCDDLQSPPSDATARLPVAGPSQEELVISLVSGAPAWPGGARRFRQTVVTLGRDVANDLSFSSPPHPVVSRFHAEITLRGGTFQLADKESTNGTFLNDRRIDRAAIVDGDRVMLGYGGPVIAVHVPGRKRQTRGRKHPWRTVAALSVVVLALAAGTWYWRRVKTPPAPVVVAEPEALFIESRIIEFAHSMQDEVDHVPPSMVRQVQYFSSELARLERETLQSYLVRTRQLLPEVERVLRSNGLPSCLAFIAFHESRFDPGARSAAGAVGLWQLMAATAREYGLRVDDQVDERLDALKSTQAAARYLKKLYLLYGDFMLTLAAYNYGPANVNQALTALLHDEPLKNRNYWYLVKLDLLPQETDEYVYKVIAEWIVATRPERYGLDARLGIPVGEAE
jgi:pSer/pThr/pTyr-binding forkhead associated (FHA) protein/soluble lytic murein transglycosylase-like protein